MRELARAELATVFRADCVRWGGEVVPSVVEVVKEDIADSAGGACAGWLVVHEKVKFGSDGRCFMGMEGLGVEQTVVVVVVVVVVIEWVHGRFGMAAERRVSFFGDSSTDPGSECGS